MGRVGKRTNAEIKKLPRKIYIDKLMNATFQGECGNGIVLVHEMEVENGMCGVKSMCTLPPA